MKPICVLGATGFIGGQIALAAVEGGWRVRATRRRPAATGAVGDAPVEWVTADLADAGSLAAAMSGCGAVFHAAATYPQDFRHISAEVARAEREMRGVLAAARAARVDVLVYTSTLSTAAAWKAGAGPGRLIDEGDFYQPGSVRSAYYEAKAAMERLALAERELPVIALLPTAVFGPGDVKPTTGLALLEAARGRIPVYIDATLDVVDGRDVAASHLAAVERGRAGERYILGGHAVPMRELLGLACAAAGRRPPRIKLSRQVMAGLVAVADALPGLSLPENIRTFAYWQPLSSERARRELGHRNRPLGETVRDTLAWFAARGR